MNTYKIEFTESQKYIIDVLADNEEEAKTKAQKDFDKVKEQGTYHYHEDGDPTTEITSTFDVTDTDDPFVVGV